MKPSPKTFTCNACHGIRPLEERTLFDGLTFCPECLERETVICDCCGERVWRDETETDGRITICIDCYDRHYVRCNDCRRLITCDEICSAHGNEGTPYCERCAEEHQNMPGIQSYYYKPSPVFHGEGKRYFGVELELDEGGETEDNANELLEIANACGDNLYAKHDGSLDDGFELVTHPMTLEYHLRSMPWDAVTKRAVQMGYRGHQTGTAGLHIHVNRDSLGKTEPEQEASIGRILFFVEEHWNELLKFSRRTSRQMEQWASRYGRKDSPKAQIKHAKSQSDRYTCVNLCNYATIEFRMFRSTLRPSTLKATLQLVNEICEVACYLSDEEMAQLSWSDFVARVGAADCPELVRYLKERRLYVSEAIESGEEL